MKIYPHNNIDKNLTTPINRKIKSSNMKETEPSSKDKIIRLNEYEVTFLKGILCQMHKANQSKESTTTVIEQQICYNIKNKLFESSDDDIW